MTHLERTSIFEWCEVSWDLDMDTNKTKCLKEFELRGQNLVTILGSIVNIIGVDLYDNLMRTRVFTLTINKLVI